MNAGLKRAVVGCGLGLAILGGGAVAFAANQTTPPQNAFQSFLDDVAGRLNVTPSALQSAIQGAEIDRVQSALQAGKINQAQASKIEARIQSGKLRGPFAFHGPRGPMLGLLKTAGSYLGLTPQQLRTDLRGGQSLAQVASGQGKSVQGLEQALLQPIQTRLNQAVQNHKITQAQETQRLSQIQARIAKMVNRSFGTTRPANTSGPTNTPNPTPQPGTGTGNGQG